MNNKTCLELESKGWSREFNERKNVIYERPYGTKVTRKNDLSETENSLLLKRQSDLRASYTHLTQNFTRNSMVAIFFGKNVRLRNSSHFKIRPPPFSVALSPFFIAFQIFFL